MVTKVSNGRVSNINDTPLSGTDAINQNYVDSKPWKTTVKAASVSNIVLSPAQSTIDDITINNGDRVLLKNQTIASENGIYFKDSLSGDYIRTNDATTSISASGTFVFIKEGTVFGKKLYFCKDNVTFGNSISFIDYGTNSGVVGPGISTNMALARYLGTDGNTIQNSTVLLDGTGNLTGVNGLTFSGTVGNGSLSLTGTSLTGLTTPLTASSAVNKAYVDNKNGNYTAVNSPTYTVLETDNFIGVVYNGVCTITLPEISVVGNKTYDIIDENGTAETYNIIVNCSGSDTIYGDSNIIIWENNASMSICNNGVSKWIIY